MKKIISMIVTSIVVLLTLLNINNCEEKIKTVIGYETNNYFCVNYPVTNIKKLDKLIIKYINKQIDVFENSQIKDKELNIDYEYLNDGNYISIILKTYNSDIEEIYTINYDIKNKKFLNINDIISEKSLIDEVKFENNQFYFTYKELVIYKNGYIKIPFNKLDMKIHLNEETQSTVLLSNDRNIDINKPVIALTFDDGPSNYTKKILKTLKKYDAVGTFFILGNKVNNYRNTLIEMNNSGNEIGNHSYNHKWLSRLSINQIDYQIETTQNLIYSVINKYPKYIRPTYGSINNKLRKNLNLEIVLWNIDTKDWKYKSYNKIANNAISKAKDGAIILMHDTYERTYKAVNVIVPTLINQGYQFVTISELEEIKKLRKLNG